MLLKALFFSLLITAIILPAHAQDGGYKLFRSFTVADGLPSNHIYTCVEDSKGFLWVATDAGIARFDGKRFQIFTTKDGLPDDDVLDVVKENNGRIWVNCFKQSPAYFDEVRNRFINAKEDSNLAKVNGTSVMYLSTLTSGGVVYTNEKGSFIFEDKKLKQHFYVRMGLGALITNLKNGEIISYGFDNLKERKFLYYCLNNKVVDSFSLQNNINAHSDFIYKTEKDKFYISNVKSGKFYIFSNFEVNPFNLKINSVTINEPIFWVGFTPKYFNILSRKGNVHVFDKKTLQLQFVINGNYLPKALYNDNTENIWISTVDKGLMLYKNKTTETFASPDNFTNTTYLCIARKPNGVLLAGNYVGQIIETDGKYFITHQIETGSKTGWQRKIIVSQNKVYSFSEGGDFVNYNIKLLQNTGLQTSTKTATPVNDSIIVLGNYGTISELNTKTERITRLPVLKKRVTAMASYKGNFIYHGSTDGLYKFDYIKRTDDSLSKKHLLLGERITAICPSPDNYVWVATASNGVVVLHNDSVVKVFSTSDGIISNSVKCLTAGRPGEIWVGTNSGISVIRYKSNLTDFSYQNLTINDGLSSNIINEMLYSNDTIYCATGNGICAIPANISLPRFDIPVQLTGISINNRDTIISNNYRLKYNQNNIELHFAGIELGGHFNYFQYRIDGDGWQKLDAHILIIQLSSGKHAVEIRAVDVNGNIGSKPLMISFNITTPFWRAPWFWITVTILCGLILFWLFRRREMAKKEKELQAMLYQKKLTELELQALKAQINPHFIFNSLNSIKLLSLQGRHDKAEKYLDKFAALLRSAMGQSALQQITLQQEIDFIHNYLSLEQLRFPDKLSFTIETDKQINAGEVLIPSMLLQPYVENAVKHGVAPLKNRNGLVQVKFYKKNNYLIVEVKDNGNGIDLYNRNTQPVGIGMENTLRRSKLYNIETKVINLKSTGEHLTGTLIQLTIPLKKK